MIRYPHPRLSIFINHLSSATVKESSFEISGLNNLKIGLKDKVKTEVVMANLETLITHIPAPVYDFH